MHGCASATQLLSVISVVPTSPDFLRSKNRRPPRRRRGYPGVKVMVNGEDVAYANAKDGNPAAPRRRAGRRRIHDAGDAGIVKMAHPFGVLPSAGGCGHRAAVRPGAVTLPWCTARSPQLVELFPTRIRYTSDCRCPITSVTAGSVACCRPPYFAIVALDRRYLCRSPISGHLHAPILRLIGLFFLPETKDVGIKSN